MKLAVISTFALALSGTAWAQDDEEKKPEKPAEEKAEGEAAPETPATPSDTAQPLVGRKGAPFPRISDEDETIYAVQRKAYLIDKAFEISAMGSLGFFDRFVTTFAPALSVSWHLSENFALELSGAYFFPIESTLTTEILEQGKLTPEIAKLTQMLWVASLGLQWSPIYGKLQIFGTSLGNFQFYVGAGGGLGQTQVQCTPGMMLDPNRNFEDPICPQADPEDVTGDEAVFVYEPATLRFMGHLSGGFRFYFANWIGLKVEVVDYLFVSRVFRPQTTEPTQRFTDAVRNNIFLQLGVSFLLGGEEN